MEKQEVIYLNTATEVEENKEFGHRFFVFSQKNGNKDTESITVKHLHDKYGEELSKKFEVCMHKKTEINICEDTVYRFENEMTKGGRTIQSKFFALRDLDKEDELKRYMLDNTRENYIFFIVSGLRYPRVHSLIMKQIPELDQEIDFAMVRERKSENILIVLSY